MDAATGPVLETPSHGLKEAPARWYSRRTVKWSAVLLSGAIVMLVPLPGGITPQSWRLLAIFVSTVIGLIL